MKKQDAYEYAENFKKNGQPPWLHGLYLHWRKLYQQPYQGITSDGTHFGQKLFHLVCTNNSQVSSETGCSSYKMKEFR
jgi:hypothetical protein